MSYSRWSHSKWYTFHSADSAKHKWPFPLKKVKENQVFEICGMPSYSLLYKDIEPIELCLKEIKKEYPDASNEQIEELKGYILEFKQDIDNEFKFLTYLKNYFIDFYYDKIYHSYIKRIKLLIKRKH